MNTLLAGNAADHALPDGYSAGPLHSLGGNLIGVTNGLSGFTATDLRGVAPQLSTLQFNGGPVPTCALPMGSVAMDQGQSLGAPRLDARGVKRPQGNGIDIGAYEVGNQQILFPDPGMRVRPLKRPHWRENRAKPLPGSCLRTRLSLLAKSRQAAAGAQQPPGAICHMMSRGNPRQDLFLDAADRQDSRKTRLQTCLLPIADSKWQIAAWSPPNTTAVPQDSPRPLYPATLPALRSIKAYSPSYLFHSAPSLHKLA